MLLQFYGSSNEKGFSDLTPLFTGNKNLAEAAIKLCVIVTNIRSG